MKTMIEQTKALQASREELLITWRSTIEKDSTIVKGAFIPEKAVFPLGDQ